MKTRMLSTRLAVIASTAFMAMVLTMGSGHATPRPLLRCTPERDARANTVLRQLILSESDLKGRIEIEMIRADGTSELTGFPDSSFDPRSTIDASVPLVLAAGRTRVLKRTGAYTNLEVLSLARAKGKMWFFQGRTCDAGFQEEEGCLASTDILEETSFQLDCK